MGRSGDSKISDSTEDSTEERNRNRREERRRQQTGSKEKIGLTRAYNILFIAYGWTLEYVKGKWVKLCPYSNNLCSWGSCFERKTCKKWDLELHGLTRDMFSHFVELASDEQYQREKRLYNVISLVMTGKPIIVDKKSQPINVTQKKRDILYDFPYDAPYPSEGEINENLNFWKGKVEEYKESGKELPLSYWDRERATACKGDKGIIARRCSINDLLWAEYKEGKYKDAQELKNRVRLDYIRISLYPGDQRTVVCKEPPPISFWKELFDNGRLLEYIEILDKAGFKDLTAVIPMTEELDLIIEHLREKKPFPPILVKKIQDENKKKSTEEVKKEPTEKIKCVGPT